MRIIGRDQLGALFGVTAKTISAWQDEGLPVAKRGGPNLPSEYESADCIAWLVQHRARQAVNETPRSRLFLLQAEELQAALDRKRAGLVAAALLEPRLTAMVDRARAELSALAGDLATRLGGQDEHRMREELTGAFRDALTRLSKMSPA